MPLLGEKCQAKSDGEGFSYVVPLSVTFGDSSPLGEPNFASPWGEVDFRQRRKDGEGFSYVVPLSVTFGDSSPWGAERADNIRPYRVRSLNILRNAGGPVPYGQSAQYDVGADDLGRPPYSLFAKH